MTNIKDKEMLCETLEYRIKVLTDLYDKINNKELMENKEVLGLVINHYKNWLKSELKKLENMRGE